MDPPPSDEAALRKRIRDLRLQRLADELRERKLALAREGAAIRAEIARLRAEILGASSAAPPTATAAPPPARSPPAAPRASHGPLHGDAVRPERPHLRL